MPRGKNPDQSATTDMSGNESAASQHSQRHTRNHPVGSLAYIPVNQLNQHLRDRREASKLSVVEERAYIETDDHDQTQDEPIGEPSNSDRSVRISDALVIKQRETIKIDRPQSTISRPTPIVDFISTPPHLQGRNTGPQFITTPGQMNQSLWDKVWDVIDANVIETPYPKSGSFEKRSHPTPIKNEHPGKRRNTNPDDAFTSRPVFESDAFTVAKKEDEHPIISKNRPNLLILNRILSKLEQQSGSLEQLSKSLEKQSISIDQQSKFLEHLTIRVDAIEERRSQRSSRSHSRASINGEKQKNDVPAQALESALLTSREERERKAGFQSVFDDDPAYVPPRTVPSRTVPRKLHKKTPVADKATPILLPTRVMPSIPGCYANLDDPGKFWAEIRTPDHPSYHHDAKHPPKAPNGYGGEWVITDENPPRWLFIDEDLEDVERRRRAEELEYKMKLQREKERLEKTFKERMEEPLRYYHDAAFRARGEGNKMFAYHRNERPSSRPAKEETSDSDDDLYKNKHKLPVQSYRSNSTHRPTVSQSPSFNRRSSTYQTSHPPPSKDRTPYRPPDPNPSDSDDENGRRRERRSSKKVFNIQSDDLSDDYIVNTRIQKIDASIIGVLDPDKGAINQYCENLRRLVTLFGEKSVIAAIPSSFTGRAKDWFAPHSMDPKKMCRVEGWIEELKAEFKVNTAAARAEAKDRKYNSADSDVMKYYYDKSGLLRTANEKISRQDLIGEI
jgi:hypothetical protein